MSNPRLENMARQIYDEMIQGLVRDQVFDAHKEMQRAREPCSVCHTHCQSTHGVAGSSATHGATPVNGSAKPSTSSKQDVMLECLNCKRPMASTRYAQHLGQCMGLGRSRGAAVRANSSNAELSMYVESDSGGESRKGSPALVKPKVRPPPKNNKKRTLENGRPGPLTSPKKQKLMPTKPLAPTTSGPVAPRQVKGTGPPKRAAFIPLGSAPAASPNYVSRPMSSATLSNTSISSIPPNNGVTIPSRLRASSTVSQSASSSDSSVFNENDEDQDEDGDEARTPTPSLTAGSTASSQGNTNTPQSHSQSHSAPIIHNQPVQFGAHAYVGGGGVVPGMNMYGSAMSMGISLGMGMGYGTTSWKKDDEDSDSDSDSDSQ